MTDDFPNDADGDALRRVANDGNDLSAPMEVDFPVVMPDEIAAQKFAAIVQARGYSPKIRKHDSDAGWDVTCVRLMLLTYDAIMGVQNELNQHARPLGGYSDGWGTFGNK
jgi:hypothetical protein